MKDADYRRLTLQYSFPGKKMIDRSGKTGK